MMLQSRLLFRPAGAVSLTAGQDGNYSINPMSYTKLDATGNALPVTATGLMWQQDTAKTTTGATAMVWKDALSYCENLTLGG